MCQRIFCSEYVYIAETKHTIMLPALDYGEIMLKMLEFLETSYICTVLGRTRIYKN